MGCSLTNYCTHAECSEERFDVAEIHLRRLAVRQEEQLGVGAAIWHAFRVQLVHGMGWGTWSCVQMSVANNEQRNSCCHVYFYCTTT